MNLLQPDLRGELLILINDKWEFRVIIPKVDEQDRLRLVKIAFDAAQMVADRFGVRVQASPTPGPSERFTRA